MEPMILMTRAICVRGRGGGRGPGSTERAEVSFSSSLSPPTPYTPSTYLSMCLSMCLSIYLGMGAGGKVHSLMQRATFAERYVRVCTGVPCGGVAPCACPPAHTYGDMWVCRTGGREREREGGRE